jgi:hypothetical protein
MGTEYDNLLGFLETLWQRSQKGNEARVLGVTQQGPGPTAMGNKDNVLGH